MSKCTLKPGDKFNFLTVVKHHSRSKGYTCICDCGNTTIVKTYALKTGKSKSCGCKREYLRAEWVAKKNFSSIKNNIYKNYKRAAKNRKYEFNLTKEEFVELITSNCTYCGSEPTMTFTYGAGSSETDYSLFKYNGVDRTDNTLGYTKENSVSCCKICNNSKASLTIKEWLQWLKKVYLFNNNSEGTKVV